jgi:hypothetical protein
MSDLVDHPVKSSLLSSVHDGSRLTMFLVLLIGGLIGFPIAILVMVIQWGLIMFIIKI